MAGSHPKVTSKSGRIFSAFPAAILAFVVNREEKFLLMRCPESTSWEIPSGALEEGESPLEGLDRELREELGEQFRYRPLYPVDVSSFKYDASLTLLSIGFVVEYLGGRITPGDDMTNAEAEWVSVEDIVASRSIGVPKDISHFARARDLFRLSKSAAESNALGESGQRLT